MKSSLSFTAAGLGAAVLIVPGLLLGLVAREPAIVSVAVGFGLLIFVNVVSAWRTVRMVSITIKHAEYVTMGSVTELDVTVANPVGADLQVLIHPDSDRKWITARVPARGTVKLSPSCRGVFTAVEAQLRSSFPLGLVRIHRRIVVSLERPLNVAPEAVPTELPVMSGGDEPVPFGRMGSPVGVRDFAAGDLRRDIHWPSSARTGSLMVKDRKQDETKLAISVVVDLSAVNDGDAVAADQVLGKARTAVEHILSRGFAVSLQTCVAAAESSVLPEVKIEPVKTQEQLLARLASAATGHSGEANGRTVSPVLRISPSGLAWQQSS